MCTCRVPWWSINSLAAIGGKLANSWLHWKPFVENNLHWQTIGYICDVGGQLVTLMDNLWEIIYIDGQWRFWLTDFNLSRCRFLIFVRLCLHFYSSNV